MLLVKFYKYQKKRFPVVILGLSLIPAILSSGSVVSVHVTLVPIIASLVASLLYLLHVRIVDEHRDFQHDNKFHNTRPIQKGVISKKELRTIDYVCVFIFLLIAFFMGPITSLLGVGMIGYSYFAEKEFFLHEKIRRHFFIYNAVNITQMFLLQIFVYCVFANVVPFSVLLITHYIFTCMGTIVFEFVRKLKRPGHEGEGKDTYTYHLGFGKPLIIYSLLAVLVTGLFYAIVVLIVGKPLGYVISSVCALFLVALAMVHYKYRTQISEQIMQLSFIVLYAIFNIVIYLLR